MKTHKRSRREARDRREAELKREAEATRQAAEAVAQKNSARRARIRSILGWSAAVVVVAGIVALLIWANDLSEKNRQAYREEIQNTDFTLVEDSSDPLFRRVDGSYYSVSTNDFGDTIYAYSTVDDDGEVIEGSVSTTEETGERFLWIMETAQVNVAVKIIEGGSSSQEPRVVHERCTATPIDASKPSYEGDPREASRPDAASMSFDDPDYYVCVNRTTLWVPDGTIQP